MWYYFNSFDFALKKLLVDKVVAIVSPYYGDAPYHFDRNGDGEITTYFEEGIQQFIQDQFVSPSIIDPNALLNPYSVSEYASPRTWHRNMCRLMAINGVNDLIVPISQLEEYMLTDYPNLRNITYEVGANVSHRYWYLNDTYRDDIIIPEIYSFMNTSNDVLCGIPSQIELKPVNDNQTVSYHDLKGDFISNDYNSLEIGFYIEITIESDGSRKTRKIHKK